MVTSFFFSETLIQCPYYGLYQSKATTCSLCRNRNGKVTI